MSAEENSTGCYQKKCKRGTQGTTLCVIMIASKRKQIRELKWQQSVDCCHFYLDKRSVVARGKE